MCRWLAYSGRPVYLEQLLFQPEHSLISQSLRARRSRVTINGDGFGVGWYGDRKLPGLYRDYRPAWNDENLRSLAEQIQSGLFFAHVRASTGTSTSRANCHPFRHGPWLFMHNGQIGGYDAVARDLEFALDPALYRVRQGTTDSETFFYLWLTFGLEADPVGALAKTIGFVERAMAANDVAEPLKLTAALTDGRRIFAVRYASDGDSPSLFHAPADGVRGAAGDCLATGDQAALIILSEPLDDATEHWSPVPDNHVLTAMEGRVDVAPLGRRGRPALHDRSGSAIPALYL
ncbi:MAG: class II glutamine amidotransferase [Alphaproteobacteria bacterium]|nr:class II glutamine amidotransferase [Alphaproteobacteria bacterium]